VLCALRHRLERDARAAYGTDDLQRQLLLQGGGFPRGSTVPMALRWANTLPENEEGIIYADIDLGMISLSKVSAADPAGPLCAA